MSVIPVTWEAKEILYQTQNTNKKAEILTQEGGHLPNMQDLMNSISSTTHTKFIVLTLWILVIWDILFLCCSFVESERIILTMNRWFFLGYRIFPQIGEERKHDSCCVDLLYKNRGWNPTLLLILSKIYLFSTSFKDWIFKYIS
jgi:hypothetical protein